MIIGFDTIICVDLNYYISFGVDLCRCMMQVP